ncbi:MAG: gamma-glutamyl phosphate reductase [Acidobacteriia bacterium]|nr:gamma-glutamyl phosphate reductase [Terriglobia bacterium]
MKVQQLVPRAEEVELDDILAGLRDISGGTLSPLAPEILEFCANFSRALFKDAEAKKFPELQALAFWMRKSELERLRQEFDRLKTKNTLPVPRGLVFHVPPANVDTIFMYSWIMSVLVGNRNILRISPRAAQQTTIICKVFNECLEAAGDVMRRNTVMIRYGHEQEITAAISAVADVRVIWGGDASVNNIRAVRIPPHCKELAFPDRYSLSVARTARYLALDEAKRKEVAAQFYNDTYWFDQMACSSPRLLIWCGEREESSKASAMFLQDLHEEVQRRGYTLDASGSMNKFTFLSRAILDQPVASTRRVDNQLTVAQLENIRHLDRDHCGGGFLFQYYAEGIDVLGQVVARKDQTLTYFGFEPAEMAALAKLLNGRGIDRIVPMGKALTFNRYWDGYDLMAEMIRHVYVE